ncbi:MAG: hypothetical protein ACYC5H_05795 [Methylovirgula sp.]
MLTGLAVLRPPDWFVDKMILISANKSQIFSIGPLPLGTAAGLSLPRLPLSRNPKHA